MWIFGLVAFGLAVLGSLLDLAVGIGTDACESSPGALVTPLTMACLLGAVVFASKNGRACGALGGAGLAVAGAWCLVLGGAVAQRHLHDCYDGTLFLPVGSSVVEATIWGIFGARAILEWRVSRHHAPSVVRPCT